MEIDIITGQPIDFRDDCFHFVIRGVDFAKVIKYKGIKWTRNDIDSSNAGRNLAGTMNRGRVVTKIKLEVTCIAVPQEIAHSILSIIQEEYLTVHYVDPLWGERNVEFYSNNVPATFCVQATDGSYLWDEISFPLVER